MSIQDVLAELQKNYLASLPDKIATIEDLWKKNELKLLKTEYHKLKGTGRTYGLPEITQLGEAMERLCEGERDTLNQAAPLSLELLARIQKLREQGQTPNLDTDQNFQTIVALVSSMPSP